MIYPDVNSVGGGMLNQGIACLAAAVKAQGNEFRLLHYTVLPTPDQVASHLEEAEPDLIGMSVSTPQNQTATRLLDWARQATDRPIIVGGIHPTLEPEEVIAHPAVDMVCIGEADEALPELCDAIHHGHSFDHIENLWVKSPGGIVRNPVRPLVEDLNRLPDPDRSVFASAHGSEHIAPFMSSRGCPYSCTYCCNHVLRSLAPNRACYVRFLGVDRAISQIEAELDQRPQITAVVLNDDILNLDKVWFRQFVREYKLRVDVPFECNTRPDLLDEETADLLDEAGCLRVKIGLESGNEQLRRRVLGRRITDDDLLNSAALLHDRGIQLVTYNMVGLPGERMATMLDTAELNARLRPTAAQVSIFYPFPRTGLWSQCEEEGFFAERPANDFFDDYQLEQPGLRRGQVLFAHRYFSALISLFRVVWTLPTALRVPSRALARSILSSRLFPTSGLTALYEKRGVHRLSTAIYRIYWRLWKRKTFLEREQRTPESSRWRMYRSSQEQVAELTDRVKKLHALLAHRDDENRTLRAEVDERTRWALELDEEVKTQGSKVVQLQEDLESRTAWAQGLDEQVKALQKRVLELQEDVELKSAWGLDQDRELAHLREEIARLKGNRTTPGMGGPSAHETTPAS